MLKRPLRNWVSDLLICCMAACLITGRYETIDLTEGRALIEGWRYWTGATLFGIASLIAYQPLKRD